MALLYNADLQDGLRSLSYRDLGLGRRSIAVVFIAYVGSNQGYQGIHMSRFDDYWERSRARKLPETTAYYVKDHVREAFNAGLEEGRREQRKTTRKPEPVKMQ